MGPARCVGAPSSANNLAPPRTGVNRAIRDLMATQIHTCSSLVRQCHRHRQEFKVVEVVVARPTSRAGTCPQCRALSMMPAESHSALAKDLGELREPWLPSGAGERFGVRVSTCDEGFSPTSAARFDWRRCSAVHTCGRQWVFWLLHFSDFIFLNATVYDRMPPVQHLRRLPLQQRRPRTRPGPHCVWGQQR